MAQMQLPQDLGDGLILRWATPADTEALAAFNTRIHADSPDDPAEYLAHWTRDLMNGNHPTTRAGDFTVVVDEKADGRIVSSMNLISQTWTYDGIEFGVGRPELVGTDEAYRRRGLVRAQFAAIHAKSAARGKLAQVITGIPWYYRQFGYEMTVALGDGRRFDWITPGHDKQVDEEIYQMRPAVEADIPVLAELYGRYCQGSLLSRVRDEAVWRYEMSVAHRESPYARHFYIIETTAGEVAGYVEYAQWGASFTVREIAVLPGQSLRAVALFLTRVLHARAQELNKEREKPITAVQFSQSSGHPLYEALERELVQVRQPYAWYVRVPDLPAFLRHIAPVLEARLAGSVMAGYSGKLRLNFYVNQLALIWENGRLQDITPYEASHFYDCDAFFPDQSFLQLLFGYRTAAEIKYILPDCYVPKADTAVLLQALFPKRPSWVLAMG
ncbi:MAG: GNAT family N-acetyltransferase [Chloroflexi bacterium]|nr:GNAT family N-acetyltransferase [Chloroflexota bacterium]